MYFIVFVYLKNIQNAPRPSEHPPQGEKLSKRLVGGIIGCKYKISSWHLNGFSYGSKIIGSTEKHTGTPEKLYMPYRDTRKTAKIKTL